MASSYHKEQEQAKLDAADSEWFADRMASLVAELKSVKEPRRASYVRGCLQAAMKQQARITAVSMPPSDDWEDA